MSQQDWKFLGAQSPHLSFPKITSARIRAVQQNQRMIQRAMRVVLTLIGALVANLFKSRRTDLKSRTSSCDINSVSHCGVHHTVYICVAVTGRCWYG